MWRLRRVTVAPRFIRACPECLQLHLEISVYSLKILAPRSRVHYYPSDSQGGSKSKRVVTIARRAVNLSMRLQNYASHFSQFRLV